MIFIMLQFYTGENICYNFQYVGNTGYKLHLYGAI
jgi:hypothetical protein